MGSIEKNCKPVSDMTLRSLEIFVAVAESGKMSDAANTLHIAQPTISQAISELEKEYGILLFDRLSRKLYITEAGLQLLSYARNILTLSSEMEKQMINLSAVKTILLGATITVGKCVLVDIVKRFEEANPNIKIVVSIENTATIESMLLRSQLDIGFVEGHIRSTELMITPAIPDELVLVCHRDHTLSTKESVSLLDISCHPFILREVGSGTRELFEEKIRQENIQITPKWTCHGSDSIIEALLANQGITVISRRLVESYVKDGSLCIVPIKNIQIHRNFSIVYHKNKFISNALDSLIQFILQKE